MTWTKLGSEFFDELADKELSDAAVRTHVEAIGWLYNLQSNDMRIRESMLRRFAGSPIARQAADELVARGLWRTASDGWVVLHHAEVIAQSLTAQVKHRDDERDRQRRKRGTKKPAHDDADVGTNVGDSVGTNVGETQTDRQTGIQAGLEEAGSSEPAEDINLDTGEVYTGGAVCFECGTRLTTPVQIQRSQCNRCYVKLRAAS